VLSIGTRYVSYRLSLLFCDPVRETGHPSSITYAVNCPMRAARSALAARYYLRALPQYVLRGTELSVRNPLGVENAGKSLHVDLVVEQLLWS